MKYRSWLFFQHFLNHYGYISNTRSGNHDVGTAVRQFQEFYGLQVSGRLDAATVRLMKKPRCGMSDPTPGGRLRRYVTLGKWSKTYLKFFVQPGEDLPHVSTIWSFRTLCGCFEVINTTCMQLRMEGVSKVSYDLWFDPPFYTQSSDNGVCYDLC